MQPLARVRDAGQPRRAAGGESLVRLIVVRPGDRLDPAIGIVVASWQRARQAPGAPRAVCCGCGAHRFAAGEIVAAVAVMAGMLEGAIEVAGICRRCSLSPDDTLFAEVLRRLGGSVLPSTASLSPTSGRA
jgi:hypothetical protein